MRLEDYYDYPDSRLRAIMQVARTSVHFPHHWRELTAETIKNYAITDSDINNGLLRDKIDSFNDLVRQAETGHDWRQSGMDRVRAFNLNLDLDEAAEFVEKNRSKNKEERERKKLLRNLAINKLLNSDWQHKEQNRIVNLRISEEMVSEYADRLIATEYGRHRISGSIVRGAVNKEDWHIVYRKAMELCGVEASDIETQVSTLRGLQQLKTEAASFNREQYSKQRKIMEHLDVASHPDYSADELDDARSNAASPEYRKVLVDTLVKKVLNAKRIHPNYLEYMRAQSISLDYILGTARESFIESILGRTKIQNPCFSESLIPWQKALETIDTNLRDKYLIKEAELNQRLRTRLKALLLRSICLAKPEDDLWIEWHGEAMRIAGLTESEVEERIAHTKLLARSQIEQMFLELPEMQTVKTQVQSTYQIKDLDVLKSRLTELWRERYGQLGDVVFDLGLGGPPPDLKVNKIWEADLLDRDPSFENEKILLDALTKIIEEIQPEQLTSGWRDETSWNGLALYVTD